MKPTNYKSAVFTTICCTSIFFSTAAAHAADTDKDGMSDGFEDTYVSSNALFDSGDFDADLNLIVDGQDDFDADGLGNAAEELAETDPTDSDTDNDGLLDGEELGQGEFGAQQVVNNPDPAFTNDVSAVFAADLDNDGDLDLLSASPDDDAIRWHCNEGDGVFGAAQDITTAADFAWDVVAADLDGDGDQDVLAASRLDNTVAWFANDGIVGCSGTFSAQQALPLVNGATAVLAADLNNDAKLDVVAVSRNDDAVYWFKNIGTIGAASFEAGPAITVAADRPADVHAADLDGDNFIDLLLASETDDKIQWLKNDGAGGFTLGQVISVTADGANSVHADDIDGDGDFDVLSTSFSDDTVALYINDGLSTGNFNPALALSTTTDGAADVSTADIDGDGDVDVISAALLGDQLQLHINIGGGTFAAAQIVTSLVDSASSVIGADLDGDGDIDIASGSLSDNKVAWYENISLSNPLLADSDGDGFGDGEEVIAGTDPRDASSFPLNVPMLPWLGYLVLSALFGLGFWRAMPSRA